MNAEQKKQAFAGILFVVLIGVMLKMFVLDGGKPDRTKTAAVEAPKDAALSNLALKEVDVDLDQLLAQIEVVSFVYTEEHIPRDPMTPLVQRVLKDGETPFEGPEELRSLEDEIMKMRVTGIIWSAYNPMAVVDNELVGVGHLYANGAKIIAIDRDRVWFDIKDAQIPLKLKEL